MKLALIGKDISHSRSQEMYENLLAKKIDYLLLDYQSENDIPNIPQDIFKDHDLDGISITAPYKKYFLDKVELDNEDICKYGLNCLKNNNKTISGTNTDVLALMELVPKKCQNFKTIILLGSGVIGSVISEILEIRSLEFEHIYRKKDGAMENLDLERFNDSIIINTCSRDFEFKGSLDKSSLFWDMNYSHKSHANYFKTINVKYMDGEELLLKQAEYALEFWTKS